MIILFAIAVVVVGVKLYFKFSKHSEKQNNHPPQELDRQVLIEKKKIDSVVPEKLNLAITTQPKEIPKPKKLSLAARAAKED